MFRTAGAYLRLTRDLPAFLRRRVTLDHARAAVAHRLASREANFLSLAERAMYGVPDGPYAFLLRQAGCEPGDLRHLVSTDGVDASLRSLYDDGVHISFAEFKQRAPLTRGGKTYDLHARSFENPLVRGHFEASTSGTSGRAKRMTVDLGRIAESAVTELLLQEAHGIRGAPMVMYAVGLPAGRSINGLLRGVLMENVPRRWFVPYSEPGFTSTWRDRATTWFIINAARAAGLHLPAPEDSPAPGSRHVARYVAEVAATEGRCHVRARIGRAARTAKAAIDLGLDLTGVSFMVAGDPTAPDLVSTITAAGARLVSCYKSTEVGDIGLGCADASDPSDVHVCSDGIGVIQVPQPVPGWDYTMNAFCFTSLLPSAPMLLLNVTYDDCGTLEQRECACYLGSLGLSLHMRGIWAPGKLRGPGVPIVDPGLTRITSRVLPGIWGGEPLDYRMVFESDGDSRRSFHFLVNPHFPMSDEALLGELLSQVEAAQDVSEPLRSELLEPGSVSVRREEVHMAVRLQRAARVAGAAH